MPTDVSDDDTGLSAGDSIGSDITEALRHSLHYATVGTLLAGVVHAANNRLTVVLSCLDVIQAPRLPDEDRRAAVELAQDAARQLADELGILNEAARSRRDPERRSALGPCLDSALRLAGQLADLTVASDVSGLGRLQVACDPGTLGSVLLRALLFAQQGGATRCEISGAVSVLEARDPAWPGLRAGSYARLEVLMRGASLADPLYEAGAAGGFDARRLLVPGGLELAAIDAHAVARRGRAFVLRSAGEPVLALFLPLSAASAPSAGGG